MFLVDGLILVSSVLLLLGTASSKLSVRLGIPVLVLFLLLGILAGSEGIGGIAFENYALAHGIGTLALAMILFDGGLRTPVSAIRLTWKPSFLLATFGVFITAVITAVVAQRVLQISFLESLLLGSIVGSTDAAAVFSVLRSGGVGLPARIASILEVESGSNDPMAIFLTVGCIELILKRIAFGPELLSLLALQMIVGALVGLCIGLLACEAVNRLELGAAGLYPILVSGFGLLAFGLAARLGGSGFLAIYLAGMVLGNRRLVFQRGILIYHDAIAWLSQIVMFVVLGLLCFPSRLASASISGLLIGAALIFVARPLAVFVTLIPFRLNFRELLFIAWVGLKGAVPITLATYPLLMGVRQASVIFDVVFVIVVLSALIQGWSLPLVARKLGLQRPVEPNPPVKLEISSLRQVDGDVVDYLVSDDSRATNRMVKDLALPEGVVIALISRGRQVIPPQGKTEIHAGDHVIVVLRQGTQPMVNQIFGRTVKDRGTIPEALEFPLRATVTVAEVEALYGLRIPGRKNDSMGQILLQHLPTPLQIGQRADFGPVSLSVLRLTGKGTIDVIGLAIQRVPLCEKEGGRNNPPS